MLNGVKSCQTFKTLMNKLIVDEPGFLFLYSWSLLHFFSLKYLMSWIFTYIRLMYQLLFSTFDGKIRPYLIKTEVLDWLLGNIRWLTYNIYGLKVLGRVVLHKYVTCWLLYAWRNGDSIWLCCTEQWSVICHKFDLM